ncbi:hypothetical protein SCOR_24605 [Sulfidibacter corallicola]
MVIPVSRSTSIPTHAAAPAFGPARRRRLAVTTVPGVFPSWPPLRILLAVLVLLVAWCPLSAASDSDAEHPEPKAVGQVSSAAPLSDATKPDAPANPSEASTDGAARPSTATEPAKDPTGSADMATEQSEASVAIPIKGTVRFVGRRKIDLADEDQRVAVFIVGRQSDISPESLDKPYVVVTKKKQFNPRLMVVPRGATVRFPNRDPIIHNVFSVSGENRFDAGRYSRGEGATHVFTHEGLVRIYCNVHHSMSALLYVIDNPWYTYADSRGRFELPPLPEGEYTVAAVHHLAGMVRRKVVIRAGETPDLELKMSVRSFRIKPHLNKDGKPYRKRKSDRY